MPKYMIQASYVGDGVKGLMKDGGSKRRAAAKTLIESLGGTLECFYFAFGEHDVVAIADMPDSATAAAASLTIGASGLINSKTIALITPEEIDKAVKKSVKYTAPGR